MLNDDELMAALQDMGDTPSVEALVLMTEGIKSILTDDELFPPSRERSLVVTKLDEAQLWLGRLPWKEG